MCCMIEYLISLYWWNSDSSCTNGSWLTKRYVLFLKWSLRSKDEALLTDTTRLIRWLIDMIAVLWLCSMINLILTIYWRSEPSADWECKIFKRPFHQTTSQFSTNTLNQNVQKTALDVWRWQKGLTLMPLFCFKCNKNSRNQPKNDLRTSKKR